MMYATIHLLLVLVSIVDILLHSVGISLMRKVWREQKKSVQLVYILHLSASELCIATMRVLQHSIVPHITHTQIHDELQVGVYRRLNVERF